MVGAGFQLAWTRTIFMDTIVLNGVETPVDQPLTASLLGWLRNRHNLTGAKVGCGEGACGVCTVLVDAQPVRACVTPLAAVVGQRVLTIEGLAHGDALHPLQQAFLEQDAFQCGYCTPGMIMAGVSLLAHNPNPSDAEIVAALNGNLCRCGMYARVLRAVRAAAHTMRTGEEQHA